jgi:O-antigen biosynthesis protein
MEIIVVDNLSTDGSIDYLQPKFPGVIFIPSRVNLGFARACNKGLSYARGKYILFLNPDTLVAEDTLEKCLHFFQHHKDAGALGVRMLDGAGKFLKESKRAFPSPLTSLFKLSGLSALFPKSKIFSRYYLGHLDARHSHKVEVLAGAFMVIPYHVLQKAGAFDKAFFMYGEDIDLSYRIQKAGYQNYYFAETEIIHFKGESTKRGSLNYVRMFYQAMSIFVHKHYGGAQASLFSILINFAIWVRASITALAKLVRLIGVPLIDAFIIFISFWLVKGFWSSVVKVGYKYPMPLLWVAFPAFTIIYQVVAYYTGLYNKVFRIKTLVRSSFFATLTLLAAYAMLPEEYRFSRGIVLFGSLLSFMLIFLFRLLLLEGNILQRPPQKIAKPFILIAGSEEEYSNVRRILQQQKLDTNIIERVSMENKVSTDAMLENIETIALASGARKLIMCAGELSLQSIFYLIQNIHISFWFHLAGSSSIVGSDLSYTSGEVLATVENFNIAQPHNRRIKRLIDILTSLIFLVSFPVHFFLMKKPVPLIKNSIKVLVGRKTWIGYQTNGKGLPPLRKAVISETGILEENSTGNTPNIDYWYARNYEPIHDIRLIFKNYKLLNA